MDSSQPESGALEIVHLYFPCRLTIMKKARAQELFRHDGEFYQYPAPDFTWQHNTSPANPELVDIKTNQLRQIGLTPRPLQQPPPATVAGCRWPPLERLGRP
ncbi:MAG: hypothetical protein GY896_14810 [Gammaproteobacteria bacterium]|nr:hypothetical protein [Gammaproteobacteria bacterium]